MPQNLVEVVLPELGESVTEGSVTGWRKREGEAVAQGEALVDITTDKVDVEIPSPATGRLARILANVGQNVKVGSALAQIEAGAGAAAQPSSSILDAQAAKSADAAAATREGARREAAPSAATPSAATAEDDIGGIDAAEIGSPASPMVRRLAERRGVDLARVVGTGPGGRITAGDVINAANGGVTSAVERSSLSRPTADVKPTAPMPAPSSPAALSTGDQGRPLQSGAEAIPLKGAQAALVKAMEESLAIPTATSFRTIAVDLLDARRRQLNDLLKAAGRKDKISFTHLIGFAIVRAIRDAAAMTNVFARGTEGPQRVNRGPHLGLAVDAQRKDGTRFLVVPVIRDADKLDFKAFVAKYEELVGKARANTLTLDDITGASITLTNPGGFGTTASIPRLMAGQGTIVATGAIGAPPGFGAADSVALNSFGAGKVMTMTSTYDHRVIQGAESGEFLRRIDQLLNGADGFYEQTFSNLGVTLPTVDTKSTAPTTIPVKPAAPVGIDEELVRAAAAAMALVVRYRIFGHTAADLDPLSDSKEGDPSLDPASLGLSRQTLEKLPPSGLRVFVPGKTVAEVLDNLRATYTGTVAYEIEHISNHEQRNWLREQIETGSFRKPLSKEEKLALLARLESVEAFERYLRRAFLGHKTFSIEGLDSMVPMLDEMVTLLANDGAAEIDIGMAHRGRLSVITQIVGWPFEDILREFEQVDVDPMINADVTGDVKYHQGARGVRTIDKDRRVAVILEANPSHLEAVDTVVEGRTRAAQTDRSNAVAATDAKRAVAVLIHGDAAFTGQGVVAEVFNMQSLAGYSTGGTLHLIANNQIGFTTVPGDGRSTRYASDLAKGFDVPIVHVNADDVEACVSAIRLAATFRRTFGRDSVIDLIGYRRFGHNETDEPAYTLPLEYDRIKNHKTVRELYASKLVAEGVLTEDDARQRLEAATKVVADAHERARRIAPSDTSKAQSAARANGAAAVTAVPEKTLKTLNAQLLTVPDGFTTHPKLVRQFERRRGALDPKGEIDWGIAESLAFGSLLLDGKPIRLTGQDTERGTFSHRHLGLYDAKTGARWIPLQHLPGAKASFEVYNSPLSEYAAVGFEYGYSTAAPDALVLWEAQFGDFVNGAQIIVDQFIAAGLAKWNQTSRLVLLLPHGYEGAGPEHSSARLERFLQLAAEGNFRVANCSTPAQYFHLLRDQALRPAARPLVIMTPKSLLRLKAASSRVSDLASGSFVSVIDDPQVKDRRSITRLILCSGKIYYDLTTSAARVKENNLAIARVELLEPFPLDAVLKVVASYPNVKSVRWVQEEPKNQGARAFVSRRIRERLLPKGIAYDFVGRPDRASTSEGYPGAHNAEQARIVAEALGGGATTKR